MGERDDYLSPDRVREVQIEQFALKIAENVFHECAIDDALTDESVTKDAYLVYIDFIKEYLRTDVLGSGELLKSFSGDVPADADGFEKRLRRKVLETICEKLERELEKGKNSDYIIDMVRQILDEE